MLKLTTFALAAAGAAAQPTPSTISVDWSAVMRPLETVAGFQTVVNPVTQRESPYHEQVYQKISDLKAPYQRYVPWLPYPKLGVAELEPPSQGSLCGFVNSGGASGIWSVSLDCGAQGAGTIDGVVFANYGKPTGFCNALKSDATCSKDVSSVVAAACVGKASCSLVSNDATFGAAPCDGARLAVEVTCSNKAVKTFTYWDFKYMDEGMTDFLTAANATGRTSIPNFSTIPQWMWNGNNDRSYYPDDPLGEVWDYEQGSTLVDPTGAQVGDYYGRLLAHYIEPGFVDEAGRFIPGLNLSFSHWEVLNELEHGLSPTLYTTLYDAIVAGIKKWCPNGSKTLKFMGLALGGINIEYISHFLNRSNHADPNIQIDAISFHHYAGAAQRDGGDAAGSGYEDFFPSGDGFVDAIKAVQAARAVSDWPNVLCDADEVGVILPDDNDPKFTSTEPGFGAIYWNAAAAMYAYLFGKVSQIGLEVLGESQLIGYPSIPFQRGPPYNGPWTAPPQYPSVSLLSWGGAFGNQGDGTARYWVLKLLTDNMKATGQSGTYAPADADVLVNTTVSGGAALSSPFCASVINLAQMEMQCPAGVIDAITFASYGTPTGSCGSWAVNASCNAANSTAIVESFCKGKSYCSFPADTPTFGDPCYDVVKHLVVEATCSSGGGGQVMPAPVFAQAFVEGAGSGAKKVLIVNTKSAPADVTMAGATGATWLYIDESTAFGPAATTTLAADTFTLAPYSLGLLKLA